jgi:hypothetical protein
MIKPIFKIVAAKKKKLVLDILTNKPLTLKTGILTTPFLPSSFENEWKSFANYKLSVRLLPEFIEVCDYIDNKIKEDLPCDESTVYSGLLRRKGDYPPLLYLSLPRDTLGRFETVVFESDKKTRILITEDNINDIFCKGREFLAEIECEKLWEFTSKDNVQRAGTTWNITQVVLQSTEDKKGPEELDNASSSAPIIINLLT